MTFNLNLTNNCNNLSVNTQQPTTTTNELSSSSRDSSDALLQNPLQSGRGLVPLGWLSRVALGPVHLRQWRHMCCSRSSKRPTSSISRCTSRSSRDLLLHLLQRKILRFPVVGLVLPFAPPGIHVTMIRWRLPSSLSALRPLRRWQRARVSAHPSS